MRLVQLIHPTYGRRIANVRNSELILITQNFTSCYTLFKKIIQDKSNPLEFIPTILTDTKLDYEEIYQMQNEWKLLPAFDHPESPLFCLLSGTGLTHKASAENRNRMHDKSKKEKLTDSMQMYMWGEEGGKPQHNNEPGVQPEWFYKGNGTNLKAFGEALEIPSYGNDGGEEPEIAGIYMISEGAKPWRIGFTVANEFSDHVMEKKNYLYLAPSKLRTCSIGPELVIGHFFDDVAGRVSIHRNGKEFWTKEIKTGEKNMCHSLKNLEYHHFKYPQHRIPGTAHVHFLGASGFSFGDGISLQSGDLMSIKFQGFGKPLVNPLYKNSKPEETDLVQTF